MTTFVSRDFQTLSGSTGAGVLYLGALFLRSVMDFTLVGETNFSLSVYLQSSGTLGSLNLDPGFEDHFLFPSGTYSPSSADINRILVLKSTSNPKFASGLFRILSTGSFSGSTTVQVDFRSTDNPPVESGSLQWALYDSELTFSSSTGDNGSTTSYATRGSAQSSRIILQSAHTSSWQVRLCNESLQDVSTNNWVTSRTVAVGVNGDSNGDFPARGEHNHGPMWFDTYDQNLAGSASGWLGDATGDWRLYFWGSDDGIGSVVFFSRTTTAILSTNYHNWCAFGGCEDETQPLPARTSQRLFSFGTRRNTNEGTQTKPLWGTAQTSNLSANQALQAIGLRTNPSPEPVVGGTSAYTFVRTNPSTSDSSTSAHPIYRTIAQDNQYISATELISVDVTAGTKLTSDFGKNIRFRGEPRRLGRFPIARMGRSNFGNFQTTSDVDRSWIHLAEGIYLPWSGSVLA